MNVPTMARLMVAAALVSVPAAATPPSAPPAGAEVFYTLSPQVRVRLTAGADAQVLPGMQYLRLLPGRSTRVFTLVLRSGRAVVEIGAANDGRDAVLVASAGRVGVVATAGESTFLGAGSSLFVVSGEGSVFGPRHGGWEAMPREVVHRYQDPALPPERSPALPAPAALRREVVVIATRGLVGLRPVAWQPVPQAVGYEVELRNAEGMSQRVRVSAPETPPTWRVEPGFHTLRVRALDERGFPGAWTQPLPVRCVAAQIPPGVVAVDDATLELGVGQTITFAHADGLRVWQSGAAAAVEPTTPVGLVDERRTLVTVRQPGSVEFALLRLLPRRVHARVSVGPKQAVWPRDRLRLAIALDDGQGRPPADIEAVPTVTLDSRPLLVDWKPTADGWLATLAPQPRCKRCVVRVEVHDQYGVLLGRDSLEVVEQAP